MVSWDKELILEDRYWEETNLQDKPASLAHPSKPMDSNQEEDLSSDSLSNKEDRSSGNLSNSNNLPALDSLNKEEVCLDRHPSQRLEFSLNSKEAVFLGSLLSSNNNPVYSAPLNLDNPAHSLEDNLKPQLLLSLEVLPPRLLSRLLLRSSAHPEVFNLKLLPHPMVQFLKALLSSD